MATSNQATWGAAAPHRALEPGQRHVGHDGHRRPRLGRTNAIERPLRAFPHMGSVGCREPELATVNNTSRRSGMSQTTVIRGGTVVDGTGAPGQRADVAVSEGHITEVGTNLKGDVTVDADGCVVAPGFID